MSCPATFALWPFSDLEMSSVTETGCFFHCGFALLCADLFLVTGNLVMIVVVAVGTNQLKYPTCMVYYNTSSNGNNGGGAA